MARVGKERLFLKRDGSMLSFMNGLTKESVRYDMKERQLYVKRKGKWVERKNAYSFFRGFGIGHVVVKGEEDKKFLKILETSRKNNGLCRNFSSFLTRIGQIIAVEEYASQGIRYEEVTVYGHGSYRNRTKQSIETITLPLHHYSKNVARYFKEHDVMFTRDFESFEKDHGKSEWLVAQIEKADINQEHKNHMLENVPSTFIELIMDFGYDPKSTLEFVYNYLKPFENMQPNRSFGYLRDYCRMAQAIGRSIKKYPKYLRSMHDIISANYNSYKCEYDEQLFKNLMKKELEHTGNKYCVVVPRSSKDIIAEGTDLNHCVSSYVERVLKQDVYIVFLREKKNPDSSLVTVEIKGKKVVQAAGSYNRRLEKDEKKYLLNYCKEKKLGCSL